MSSFAADNTVLLHDAARQQWLLFRAPRAVLVAHTVDDVRAVVDSAESHTQAGGYAAGFLAYEAAPAFDPALVAHPPGRFPLAWFGLYDQPEPFTWPDDGAAPAPVPLTWEPSVTPDRYHAAIGRIRDQIAAGATYQVNYTLRLRAAPAGDPWALFTRLIAAQGAGYGAYVQLPEWIIACGSPELFFRRDGRELESRPMKGTAPRGLWYADDCRRAAELQASEKNRAENVMIVDMVRNDIGRIADVGSVHVPRLFDIEQYPTVWQMTSTVRGAADAGLGATLGALFPPASITGAPKARTMGIIADLEDSPRHIYTGTIGYLAPQRQAQFNVAIRTVLIDRGRDSAEYGVGGGIVWDSVAAAEWDECRTKARVLTQATPAFDLLETLLWTPEDGYALRERHVQRLIESAAYFGYPCDRAAVERALDALPAADGPLRVRLRLDRRGRLHREHAPLTPLPSPYRVTPAAQPVDSAERLLYHKTTARAVYADALRARPGYDDVLLWNERGEITESCIANVVVELDGRLVTPPAACGLLPGTLRAALLAAGDVAEQVITRADLARATAVYLVNSVRGRWPVTVDGV